MDVCATPLDTPRAVEASDAAVEVGGADVAQEEEEDDDNDGAVLPSMQLQLRPNLPLQRTYIKRDLGRAPAAASPLPPPARGVQAPVAAVLPPSRPAAWW